MRKKILVTVALTISSLFSINAKADINSQLKNICAIVKADDKAELRNKMRSVDRNFNMKLRDYYNGISCGNKSLIKTAFLNNSIKTGTLIIKKMPKSALKSKESDGSSIVEWAEGREGINPKLISVLNSRIN